MQKVLSKEFCGQAKGAVNPYDKERTIEQIFQVISTYPLHKLQQKKFYDIK